MRILQREMPDFSAAERIQVGAAVERQAKVAGNAADIGSFRAGNAEAYQRQFAGRYLKVQDLDRARLQLDFFARACQRVEALAVYAHRAEHGRYLLLFADEGPGRFKDQLLADMFRWKGLVYRLLFIVAGSGGANKKGTGIFFWQVLEGGDLLGFFAGADNEQASGQGIERTGMTDLEVYVLTVEQQRRMAFQRMLQFVYRLEGRPGVRLVDEEKLSAAVIGCHSLQR